MIGIINDIDISILTFIQENLRSDAATPFWRGISLLGTAGAIWIAIIIILLINEKTRRAGITCAVSLALEALIASVILKPLVARIRPYEAVEAIQHIGREMFDYSFPSGHTGASFACSLVMLKLLPKKIGIPAVIFSVLMGYSRLYLGVHYPSDVLAGFIIGAITSTVSLVLCDRYFKRRS